MVLPRLALVDPQVGPDDALVRTGLWGWFGEQLLVDVARFADPVCEVVDGGGQPGAARCRCHAHAGLKGATMRVQKSRESALLPPSSPPHQPVSSLR